MGYLRLLRSEYMQDLLDGRIYLGSLRYYRLLEATTGDATRGDKHEVSALNDINNLDSSNIDKANSVLHPKGIHIEPGSRLRIYDMWHGFTLCFSEGEINQIWQNNARQFNADACVEIIDPEALAVEICRAVSAMFPTLPPKGPTPEDYLRHHNARQSSSLMGVYAGPVSYDAVVENNPAETGLWIEADPFKKRSIYSVQQEYRILVRMSQASGNAGILVKIPQERAKQLLKVERGEPTTTTMSNKNKRDIWVSITHQVKDLVNSVNRVFIEIPSGLRRESDGAFAWDVGGAMIEAEYKVVSCAYIQNYHIISDSEVDMLIETGDTFAAAQRIVHVHNQAVYGSCVPEAMRIEKNILGQFRR